MTTDTDELINYGQRAAARAMPLDWVEPAFPLQHGPQLAYDFAVTGQTFWADGSIYQPVITSAYPYPKFGFRGDSGTDTDGHAPQNWAYCEDPSRMPLPLTYAVFKPGQRAGIMRRLRNTFGSDPSSTHLCAEIDMESGTQFAGPGDHSAEANALASDLADWLGDQRRVQGYANGGDWAACWPTPPSWMKRRLAKYSASAWPVLAGYYAVQYYGALPYGSPPGFPRACAPFGSYVDMNVTPRTISQILADYGIGEDPVTTPSQWGGPDQAAFKGLVSDAVTGVLNSMTAPGQLSFKNTVAALLGTVQGLVNQGNQQTGQIVNSVNAARDAVIDYLTAHPGTVDLTDQDKADIVAGVQAAFSQHGVNVDPTPILDALNARLAA